MVLAAKPAVEVVAKVYKLTPGNKSFSLKDAPIIGAELERIQRANPDGFVLDDVVDAGRPEEAPLHRFFEWNERIAAQAFRIGQAMKLVQGITVEVTTRSQTGKTETQELRGWLNVVINRTDDEVDDEPKQRRYVDVVTIAQTPDYSEQVIAKAQAELAGWRRRYQQYSSLPAFVGRFDAVMQAIEALPKP